MAIWKLEACRDDERIGCRWGFVVAATEAEALAAVRETSGFPFVWVHRMRDGMIWPGVLGQTLYWSS